MGATLAEKILATHTTDGKATAGEIVEANVDFVMVHEVLGSRIMPILDEMGVDKVWDPKRILVVNDHWAPAPNIQSAEIHQRNRDFVRKHGITHFCDVNCGICHQVMADWGLARPGELIVGCDSHTCSYGAFNAFSTGLAATDTAIILATGSNWFRVPESRRFEISGELPDFVMSKDLILRIVTDLGSDGATYESLEFHGPTIDSMTVPSRMTMCNMSVEAGAKTAIMTLNESATSWLNAKSAMSTWTPMEPDRDAGYVETHRYDLDSDPLGPIVSAPNSPANGKAVEEVEGIEIDQAFIGSCTNGRLEDIEIAARILKGKNVAQGVRLILTPASMETYLSAVRAGFIETLITSGAVVTNPTCGACVGGHLGILGPDEVAISSTNRNFRGRMGHPESLVYLASPATVAASALKGVITDPRSVA
ncbi:MAG: 3-isopropylmalate dehydratase large subunit [Candidatus Thorarchaeota archaeon]|nr:MAG: 3-isopropylmalate dehydratase large subunit [Candidatus Thorarchaeota archaeon]